MKRGLAAFRGQDFEYEDLTRRLNAEAVMRHYSPDNATEQTNTDGTTEIIHSCLIDRVEPHHANGDANPSASFNVDKKLYVCYAYWGGDLLHLIMKMERKDDLAGIIDILPRFLDGATKDSDAFREQIDRILAPRGEARRQGYSAYSSRVLEPWSSYHPYLAERGISEATAAELQVGYDPQVHRIVIPHFVNDVLVGWQKRSLPERPAWPATDPAIPKYKSSPGFPKSTTLYHCGGDLPSGQIIVVESPFSVLKAHTLGFRNVVATFGAKITDDQVKLLSRPPAETVVWMDDDEAGRLAERSLVKRLWRECPVRVVTPDKGMDLGDYDTAESVQAKIDAALPARSKIMIYREEQRSWARSKLVSAR